MKRDGTKRPDKKQAQQRAAAVELYIAEIDRFATMLRDQQVSIREIETQVTVTKVAYEAARDALREAKEIEHGTVSLLLKFIRPGSIDVLPLFDTMEPADEDVQGAGAAEWRNDPIVLLELSAAALRALIDADVVLVGQLQDRILASRETGDEWALEIPGISEAIAQAIEAKLQAFVEKRGSKK
jgi:hypothetical protein